MKATVEFKGGLAIERALRELGESRAIRRAGRAALKDAATPVRDDAKANAPEDEGDLIESIKIATAKRDRGDDGNVVAVVIGIDRNVQPATYVPRKSGKGSYRDPGVAGVGPMKEFGTEKDPAEPFMRPAWERHADRTPGRVARALWPAIAREAKRLARKAGLR